MFVNSSTGVLKKVLMCRPTYLKAIPINEIAKKWSATELEIEKMEMEHASLVKAYEDNGVVVEMIKANSLRGNSVFSRDFGGCIKEGYILGNFKEPIRYLEKDAYKKRMEELKVPLIVECKEGIFEGGDFTFIDDKTLAIGMIARTNQKGIEEIINGISKYGYKVIPVPCDEKYLHLDMCFNLITENLAVACKRALPFEFLEVLNKKGIEIIDVSEESIFEHGCNLESIGNNKVISLKQNYYVNGELIKRGINVIDLDIIEVLKAGGGPHCMTFPLQRE